MAGEQALPSTRGARAPTGSEARRALVAATLARVRTVIPLQFLKTPGDIQYHTKILHNVLLNNMWLHDTLRGDAAGGSAPVASLPLAPDARERARISTGALELVQRTAAITGLARAFANRASLRSMSGKSASRLCNPLAAFFGAPGGERRKPRVELGDTSWRKFQPRTLV